jgi:hypothetical protein
MTTSCKSAFELRKNGTVWCRHATRRGLAVTGTYQFKPTALSCVRREIVVNVLRDDYDGSSSEAPNITLLLLCLSIRKTTHSESRSEAY